MLFDLLQALVERQPGFDLTGVQIFPPLSALQIYDTPGRDRKTKLLVFNQDSIRPTLFVKLAHAPASQAQLAEEFANMRQIWHLQLLKTSLPQPLTFFKMGAFAVLVQEALPGIPLSVLLRRRTHLRPRQVWNDLSRAFTWLQHFQRATLESRIEFPGRDGVEERLVRMTQSNAGFELPQKMMDKMMKAADHVQGMSLPLVGCHGDFWPGNFLISDLGVAVTDWENYTPQAWPFYDFFLFLTTFAQTYPWDGWRWSSEQKAFQMIFMKGSWLSDIARYQVRQYFEGLGLPFDAAWLFFMLFLIEKTSSGTERGPQRESQRVRWRARLSYFVNQEDNSIFA